MVLEKRIADWQGVSGWRVVAVVHRCKRLGVVGRFVFTPLEDGGYQAAASSGYTVQTADGGQGLGVLLVAFGTSPTLGSIWIGFASR